MRHNLAALGSFVEIMEVTSHTGQCRASFIFSDMLLTRFIPIVWSTTSESTLLGLAELDWSSRFSQQSKMSCTFWLLYCDRLHLHLSQNKCFWLLWSRYGPVWTRKAEVPESDNMAHSSLWLLNHKRSEAMQNMSAHKLSRYYQPQWVPTTVWSASVSWYKRCELGANKISQNYWLTVVQFILVL